ncbi:10439_t:CDS:1 [Ambispora gerdemannii]|uniref:10439_t:CDS:1 n=1 Tax=Ambispora gerdemannii TaxID=144530 RepID=A0A9N8WAP9_9GLOM|nr:10439_t:CDS:1 [Ambispora gerdemannii]
MNVLLSFSRRSRKNLKRIYAHATLSVRYKTIASNVSVWSDERTKKLINAINKHGKNWQLIQKKYFPDRTDDYLYRKWINETRNERLAVTKKRWTKEELDLLKDGVERFGNRWSLIQKTYFPNKNPGSLCKKWRQYDPDNSLMFASEKWTKEELDLLKDGVKRFGNRWSLIQKTFLPNKKPGSLCRKWRQCDPNDLLMLASEKWTKEELNFIKGGAEQSGRSWNLALNPYFSTVTSLALFKKWSKLITNNSLRRIEVNLHQIGVNRFVRRWSQLQKTYFPEKTLKALYVKFYQSTRINKIILEKIHAQRWTEEVNMLKKGAEELGRNLNSIQTYLSKKKYLAHYQKWLRIKQKKVPNSIASKELSQRFLAKIEHLKASSG